MSCCPLRPLPRRPAPWSMRMCAGSPSAVRSLRPGRHGPDGRCSGCWAICWISPASSMRTRRTSSRSLRDLCEDAKPDNHPRGDLKVEARGPGDGLTRIGNVPIYAIDSLVRRAPALQRTPSAGGFGVFLNSAEAAANGIAEGDTVEVRQNGSAAKAQVSLDDAVPAGCARIPAGVPGSEALGDQIGPVSVTKV